MISVHCTETMSELQPSMKQRQEQTRQAILDAALDMINERGLDGISMREIARRVKYSPMGLYEYFPNKRALIDAVMSEGYNYFVLSMMALSPDLTALERYRTIGLNYLRFAEQYPAYFTLISRYISVNDAPEHVVENTFRALVAAVQSCVDEGAFLAKADYGVDEIAWASWSMVHGMANLRAVQLKDVETNWERVAEQTIDAFIAGLSNREA